VRTVWYMTSLLAAGWPGSAKARGSAGRVCVALHYRSSSEASLRSLIGSTACGSRFRGGGAARLRRSEGAEPRLRRSRI
jgi:hypothetical protein